MQYIKSSDFNLKNTCVTLGKFDGLHLGHRKLLRELTEWKKQNGGESVLFTFDFHPDMLFGKKGFSPIYTEEEKKALLTGLGLDYFIAFPFTRDTSRMEAEDFIEQILVKQLGVRMIAVGEDNRFGHNRRGNVKMLREFGEKHDFKVIACSKVRFDNGNISSTRVREALCDGDIALANRLLGEKYHLFGKCRTVYSAMKKGERTVLELMVSPEKLLPPNGQYKTLLFVKDHVYEGIALLTGERADINRKVSVFLDGAVNVNDNEAVVLRFI